VGRSQRCPRATTTQPSQHVPAKFLEQSIDAVPSQVPLAPKVVHEDPPVVRPPEHVLEQPAGGPGQTPVLDDALVGDREPVAPAGADDGDGHSSPAAAMIRATSAAG